MCNDALVGKKNAVRSEKNSRWSMIGVTVQNVEKVKYLLNDRSSWSVYGKMNCRFLMSVCLFVCLSGISDSL